MQEVQKGYRLHERVLRPARVVVSGGPPEAEQESPGKGKKGRSNNKE